jgi:hypothetical protein
MSESEQLFNIASIAEEIWLTAEPQGSEIFISKDLYDKLYLALDELAMTEEAQSYLAKNNWDSCLTKGLTPVQVMLRKDVQHFIEVRDGGSPIRLGTRQKLKQLQLLAQEDLCPAWVIMAVAKKAVELDRANLPQDDIDLAALLTKTLPNWREIRDYLHNKRTSAKTKTTDDNSI